MVEDADTDDEGDALETDEEDNDSAAAAQDHDDLAFFATLLNA